MYYLLTAITCHCVWSRVNVVEQVHVATFIYCYLAILYVRYAHVIFSKCMYVCVLLCVHSTLVYVYMCK